ncbi:glycosyltransferase family 57 protein, partial [Erysiphe pulchra]
MILTANVETRCSKLDMSIPQLSPSLTQCAVVATAFKLLLFPAYKSTDFEVHRNWLAITNSLPVHKWYLENTSKWTLDYPPFFAYFEWMLSHIARIVDPEITKVHNLEYDNWQTIYFQRITVIVTELVLLYALSFFVKSAPAASQKASHAAAILILLSPGFLIIDHIHFQYNGFLYAVAPYLGLTINQNALSSSTRGLVGDTSFAILPEVTPKTTLNLTILSQVLPLIKLFFDPSWDTFIGAVTLCGYSSFLFGWHVHEKAVLLIILPFSLIAAKDRRFLSAFRPLAIAGYVSLFPLLFRAAEFPIKTSYTFFWTLLFLVTYDRVTPPSNNSRVFLLDRLSLLYIIFSIPLVIYCSLIHEKIWKGKLQFFPLMLLSNYSAVGVVSS